MDLGRYHIRVMEENRIYIRSLTTGRSEVLFRMSQIVDFIKADIQNDVLVVDRLDGE